MSDPRLFERVAENTIEFERSLNRFMLAHYRSLGTNAGSWCDQTSEELIAAMRGKSAYRRRYISTGLAEARRRAGKRA